MNNIKLRILDYFDVLSEINRITENKNFKTQKSFNTILDGIEVPYYTLGHGSNKGCTHGSEIITTVFVLKLMEMS